MGKISQIRLYIKKEKGITRKELDALTESHAENVDSQCDKQTKASKEKRSLVLRNR